jgi:hypothetical protein
MQSRLSITASARLELLGTRTRGAVCIRVAAYEVESAASLEMAYKRATHLKKITACIVRLNRVWTEIIPSTDRRPTHFLLMLVDDTPVLKGVFCLVDVPDMQKFCDSIASGLGRDWDYICDLSRDEIKRHCCKIVAAEWALLG